MGTMTNLPIVCTLTPETVATRRAQLLPGLFRRASATEVTSEGYCLRFDSSPATLHAVAVAIEAERHCCRFLGRVHYHLAVYQHFSDEGEPVPANLEVEGRITGPDDLDIPGLHRRRCSQDIDVVVMGTVARTGIAGS